MARNIIALAKLMIIENAKDVYPLEEEVSEEEIRGEIDRYIAEEYVGGENNYKIFTTAIENITGMKFYRNGYRCKYQYKGVPYNIHDSEYFNTFSEYINSNEKVKKSRERNRKGFGIPTYIDQQRKYYIEASERRYKISKRYRRK